MKLIMCSECGDVRKLHRRPTYCACGKSGGQYKSDGRRAVIWGRAIPIGIDNSSLLRATVLYLGGSKGGDRHLEAWVFEPDYHRIERLKEAPVAQMDRAAES